MVAVKVAARRPRVFSNKLTDCATVAEGGN
jgi:hypothetical protein